MIGAAAYDFVVDSLYTPVCLHHAPDTVAIAAIYLTLRWKKVEMKLGQWDTPWFTSLFSKNQAEIEAIAQQMLDNFVVNNNIKHTTL